MSLWRLEWLRLTRTRRWLSIAGVLLLFGFISPLTVRYAEDIFEQLGPADVQISLPKATPYESMSEFVGNAQQLGLLVVVLVSASALAFDAKEEISVFLRTRVRSVWQLLIPKFGVNAGVAATAFLGGCIAAWYETLVLLGDLPVGRTLLGIFTGVLFEVFVVATVAFAAGVGKSYIQTVVVAVSLLLSLPLLHLVGPIAPWLPSQLSANLAELGESKSFLDYARPVLTTAIAIPLFLAFAVRRMGRREL